MIVIADPLAPSPTLLLNAPGRSRGVVGWWAIWDTRIACQPLIDKGLSVSQVLRKYQMVYLVVSNIFYFHPYLGKISNLTNIFQGGWNHQLVLHRYHGLLHCGVPQASLLGHTTVLHADAWFKFTSTNPSKINGYKWVIGRLAGQVRQPENHLTFSKLPRLLSNWAGHRKNPTNER